MDREIKIKLWLTAILVAVTTFCVMVFPDESKAQDIACMGDSITEGYGVGAGDGYCELIDGVNFGESSKTSAWGLSILGDVIAADPDIVIVEYGLNDAYGNNVPLSRFRFNMRRIIKKLQKSGIEPLILIANPSIFTSFNAGYKDYVRAMRALTVKHDLLLADAYREFAEEAVENSTDYYYDDLHPNEAGHELITELILEAIE